MSKKSQDNGRLTWGGFLQVRLDEKRIKEINKKLNDDKAAWHLPIVLSELLEKGFTVKLAKYQGAPQFVAMNTEDQGDGKQYAVSAHGFTIEVAAYCLLQKLEQIDFDLSSGTKTDNSDELPAFG